MKLEIIERTTDKLMAIYSIEAIAMSDFQGWTALPLVVPINELADVVANLNATDPEAHPTTVEFFLSDPLKNQVLSRLAKNQTEAEDNRNQFTDQLNEVTEQVSTPPLKSSTILSAVVVEISQNHLPHKAYEVRISDE